MQFWKTYSKWLILLLVVGVGIIITAPYVNYQNYLAQGDHGRDLYAAQAVNRGEIPYRDFWWVYGPLMPYYYGLFFKIFGVHISSMILGKLLLRILGGVLICLGMMQVTSELAAFICACWFMLFQQDFFFTYNHSGGIVMILGVTLCLLSYINKSSMKPAWGSLIFIFILCLIKINFGLAALAVTVITLAISDSLRRLPVSTAKKFFYTMACIGLPLMIFIIYWFLLKGLSIAEIRQCLPYMEGDQPYSTTPLAAISSFLQMTFQTIKSNNINIAFAVIINLSALRCLYLLVRNKLDDRRKIIFILSFGMLCLFYVANFHEYLKSGVWYRAFWSQPLSIMLIFLLIDTATQSIPKLIRSLVFLFIALLAVFCGWAVFQQINATKTKDQYLSLPRGDIYVANTSAWITTVQETTEFLNKTLKPNELFFALPYDCLYYYLTDKKSPTRQLIFFEHIKITTDQEKSVIAELEKNHVNYVLISNRAFAHEELGLGILGASYCPLIGKYIEDNFAHTKAQRNVISLHVIS